MQKNNVRYARGIFFPFCFVIKTRRRNKEEEKSSFSLCLVGEKMEEKEIRGKK